MSCDLCPLHQTAITICVAGSGEGKTLIVGQNPGAHEDAAGLPFIGKSGKLLADMLADAGFKFEDYRLTNAVRCRTPQNRPPEHSEVDACRVHLKAEILEHRPTKIIALGDTALQTLTRKSGVKSKRGTSLPLHADYGYEAEVWVTYHPAFVMRMQPVRNTVVADLRKARDAGLEREPIDWYWADGGESIVAETVAWDIETDFDFEKETGGENVTQIGIAADDFDTIVDRAAPGRLLSSVWASKLVTHNGWAFDVPKMRAIGVPVDWGDDTMALAYLDDETQPLALEALAVKYLGVRGWKDERVAEQGSDEFALYNARDAHYTLQLYRKLIELLGDRKKIADTIMLPAWLGLRACSERGIYISPAAVATAREHFDAEYLKHRTIVLKMAQTPMTNPNSNVQMAAELTERGYGLPPTPSGGESVAIGVLNEFDIDGEEPFINAVKDYRKAQKMISTYIKPYEEVVASADGRVHSEYTILRTLTGRTSARKLNVQNLPRLPMMRAFFSAPPGKELLSMDYKAIEFRLAAWIAQERGILDRYASNPDWDPHIFVTAYLYSILEADVTKDQRNNVGKSANFGLLYLASPSGLQEYMKKNGIYMSLEECERIWRGWHALFPGFGYVDAGTIYGGNASRVWKFLEKNGFVENAIGRRRHFGDVQLMNFAQKGDALREAVNMQVQSLAFDIAGLGLANCHEAGLPVVAFLHDDIKFEFDEGESASKLEQIAHLMIDEPLVTIERTFGVKIDVPLLVEHKIVKGTT